MGEDNLRVTCVRVSAVWLLIIGLSACGGGSSGTAESSPPVSNPPPSPYGRELTFEPPTWSGVYNVGSTQLSLVDSSREEQYTENTNDFREVHIRLFYPTDHAYSVNRLPVVTERFWQRLGSEEVIAQKALRQSNYNDVLWDIELDVAVSDQQSGSLCRCVD